MILHEAGGHRLRAAIISVVLAVGAYAALAFWSDAKGFMEAARRIGAGTVAAVLALSALNYALRAVRWKFFLARLGHPLPWRASTMNYLTGFALTTTPGKAGEAIRSLLLKRGHGVPVTDSLAAFFAERFSDIMAIAALGTFAIAMLPGGTAIAAVAFALVAAALWVAGSDARIAALARILGPMLPHRFVAPLAALAGQAGRLTRGRTLAAGLALSIVAWLAEGYALFLIMEAMGSAVDAATAVGIYCVAILGGALFFLPGGLGTTEALMIALLAQSGMGTAGAAAATVISRVTTLWFAVALGWLVLLLHRDPGRL